MNQQITRLQVSMTLKLLIKGSAVQARPGSPSLGAEVSETIEASAQIPKTSKTADHLTRGVNCSLNATLMQPVGRYVPSLKINPSYWGEKIQSESRFGGPHRKFNADTFRENVLASLDYYDLDESRKAKIIEEMEHEVFEEEDEGCARRALSEFEYRDEDGKFEMTDTWKIDGKGYTYHYLWCCYAIQWGIAQYDATLMQPGRCA